MSRMFPNFVRLFSGEADPSVAQRAFVEEVQVEKPEPRSPRLERMIAFCWILIAIKHVIVIWAVARYRVPLHQLWINFPTWALGTLATGLYFWRVRRR